MVEVWGLRLAHMVPCWFVCNSVTYSVEAGPCSPGRGGWLDHLESQAQSHFLLRQLLLFDPMTCLSEGQVRLPESQSRTISSSPTAQTRLGVLPAIASLGH